MRSFGMRIERMRALGAVRTSLTVVVQHIADTSVVLRCLFVLWFSVG